MVYVHPTVPRVRSTTALWMLFVCILGLTLWPVEPIQAFSSPPVAPLNATISKASPAGEAAMTLSSKSDLLTISGLGT